MSQTSKTRHFCDTSEVTVIFYVIFLRKTRCTIEEGQGRLGVGKTETDSIREMLGVYGFRKQGMQGKERKCTCTKTQ